MTVPLIVAIDGPAGSGKSSIARAVARAKSFAFLDTGAAYRALTWFALESGLDLTDPDLTDASILDLLPNWEYVISTDPDVELVTVGGVDVTLAIREPGISAHVSRIARIPAVRTHVNDLFRAIMFAVEQPGVVAEGRDITTVVAPDAPVRILLTASEEVRIARRAGQLAPAAAASAADLVARDRADAQVVDFLTAADGVTTVDSTELDFDETVAAVVAVVDAGIHS
ncbi:(d)CMP kinase [Agromyces seonyuensis]|uniref:Cytidylate kinase n=1 Tax=Agromyces seonyuensis TaxID=2662446 RepID=A0A6I4P7Q1_9MICO|nr:(d)CMP kinase [Agromyces seonyuensis]MWB99894.1 (d)CMP kinase [Agromyces seonyuensis]